MSSNRGERILEIPRDQLTGCFAAARRPISRELIHRALLFADEVTIRRVGHHRYQAQIDGELGKACITAGAALWSALSRALKEETGS